MDQLHEQIGILEEQWAAIYSNPASKGAATGHLSEISFDQLNEVVGIVCNWLDRRRAPSGFAPTFHVARALAGTSLAGAISAARNIHGGQPAHYPSFVIALNQTLSALHSLFVYSDKSDSVSSDLTGKLNEALVLIQTAQRELSEKMLLLGKSDEQAARIGAMDETIARNGLDAEKNLAAIGKLLEEATERVEALDVEEEQVVAFRQQAEALQSDQTKIIAALKSAQGDLGELMEATKEQSASIVALLPKGASAALAHAFSSRCSELIVTKWIWFGAFVVSIGCLAGLAYHVVFHAPGNAQELWQQALQGFEWVETGRSWSPPRWKRMAMR